MKNIILNFIFIFIFNFYYSQFLFDYSPEFEVFKGNKSLQFPWAGGLNFVQSSEIDFNFDGYNDLFLFDRSADNIRLFEHMNNANNHQYKLRYDVNSLFPDDLRHRVALIDFNNDGKNDIFTYGLGGIKVYKNIGSEQTGLQWQLHKSLLYSDYGNNISNLFVSSTDIPALVDVDFDGDIDILTFDLNGEALEYHKNMGIEWYNNSDSLVYILKNRCWGKFKEDPVSFNILLNNNTFPCDDGNIDDPEFPIKKPFFELKENYNKKNRHTGSTILAIDIDNSGVYDLLIGDVSGNNISLLTNNGTSPNTNSTMNSYTSNFPENSIPISFSIFPSIFYLDLNFDNKKDLLISGNAKNAAKNFDCTLWYKNISENDSPIFVKQNDFFISSEMIDNGTGSIPVLFDENGDGLKDLIISSLFRYKDNLEKESALLLYRNIGTNNEPKYQFIDNDYLSLSQLNLGFRVVPSFGDIDNDNDDDLFIGNENGTVIFLENNGIINQTAQFNGQAQALIDNQQNIIDVGTYSYPQLFDLNKDSLLDLIIGNKSGQIYYYKNIGTNDSCIFELENSFLGNINLSSDGIEYLAPHFFDYHDTIYLILGNSSGKLYFYNNIEDNIDSGDSFNLENSFFRQINVEAYSSCLINDIDNDSNLNMFVGGDLGGLYLFEHNQNSQLGITKENLEEKLILYPNPFSDNIKILDKDNVDYKIYSIQGLLISEGKSINNVINTENLDKGTYIIIINQRKYKIIKL